MRSPLAPSTTATVLACGAHTRNAHLPSRRICAPGYFGATYTPAATGSPELAVRSSRADLNGNGMEAVPIFLDLFSNSVRRITSHPDWSKSTHISSPQPYSEACKLPDDADSPQTKRVVRISHPTSPHVPYSVCRMAAPPHVAPQSPLPTRCEPNDPDQQRRARFDEHLPPRHSCVRAASFCTRRHCLRATASATSAPQRVSSSTFSTPRASAYGTSSRWVLRVIRTRPTNAARP